MKRKVLSCVIIYVRIAKLEKVMKNLVLLLMLLFCGSSLFAEEIPNGDGDLIWEQDISPRFVRDAKFHPITGNIIAAVNHEIWEIDVKDGHKIRVFEGGPATGPYDQFERLQITSDGKTMVTGMGGGIKGLIIWDYESGKIRRVFDKVFPWQKCLGIFPDNNRVVLFCTSIPNSTGKHYLVIYDMLKDSIIKSENTNSKLIQQMSLSKDGKYLAVGCWNSNENKYKMELWDAETLTHIRDFGEAFSANEFWDVKISNDNKYFGFLANNKYYFYDFDGKVINLAPNAETYSFCFDDSNKFIVYGDVIDNIYQVNVKQISNNKIKYQYIKTQPFLNFTLNSKNQFFSGYSTLRLFSNHWFTVDVNEENPEVFKINYFNNKLTIENSIGLMINKINITDITGKIIYSKKNELNSIDIVTLDMLLKNGVYFATIHTANGKIYSQKFIVIE